MSRQEQTMHDEWIKYLADEHRDGELKLVNARFAHAQAHKYHSFAKRHALSWLGLCTEKIRGTMADALAQCPVTGGTSKLSHFLIATQPHIM